jgi:hypothetical protein
MYLSLFLFLHVEPSGTACRALLLDLLNHAWSDLAESDNSSFPVAVTAHFRFPDDLLPVLYQAPKVMSNSRGFNIMTSEATGSKAV